MRLNGLVYRWFRAPSSGLVRVQFGPGQRNYMPGWINIDANLFSARIDLWANLTDALPFRDNTVDAFYSHHVVEHLPDYYLLTHFQEMFRCLKPGGMIRIGGPNADSAIRKYVQNDLGWFSDYPDSRPSLGGRFANFILCRGEHLTILTFSYLSELLSKAGFANIRQCLPQSETFHPQVIDETVLSKEHENCPECPHTLIIEADRPLR